MNPVVVQALAAKAASDSKKEKGKDDDDRRGLAIPPWAAGVAVLAATGAGGYLFWKHFVKKTEAEKRRDVKEKDETTKVIYNPYREAGEILSPSRKLGWYKVWGSLQEEEKQILTRYGYDKTAWRKYVASMTVALYYCRGGYWFINDDEPRLYALFGYMSSRHEISYIAWAFSLAYGQPLKAWLAEFLSTSELSTINSICNSKPEMIESPLLRPATLPTA
jgi:hypothetical protein